MIYLIVYTDCSGFSIDGYFTDVDEAVIYLKDIAETHGRHYDENVGRVLTRDGQFELNTIYKLEN